MAPRPERPRPFSRWVLLAEGLLLVSGLAFASQRLQRELSGQDHAERVQRALTMSEDERLTLELGKQERRAGDTIGREAEVLRRLRAGVDPDATVFVVGTGAGWQRRTFLHATVTLYPRRFQPLEGIPPTLRERATGLDEHTYLLHFSPTPSPVLEGWFELVDAGPDFHLWRHPAR